MLRLFYGTINFRGTDMEYEYEPETVEIMKKAIGTAWFGGERDGIKKDDRSRKIETSPHG